MNWKELIEKISKGEALTDEDKAALSALEDPASASAARKAAEDAKAALQSELDAERAKLKAAEKKAKDLENAKLPEVEQLKNNIAELTAQISTLTGERDAANADLASLRRAARLKELSEKHGVNAEYLDFRATRDNLDLNDDNAVTAKLAELKKSDPAFFKADQKPGPAPAPAPTPAPTSAQNGSGSLLSLALKSLKNTSNL